VVAVLAGFTGVAASGAAMAGMLAGTRTVTSNQAGFKHKRINTKILGDFKVNNQGKT
jgi:hypothetical protein